MRDRETYIAADHVGAYAQVGAGRAGARVHQRAAQQTGVAERTRARETVAERRARASVLARRGRARVHNQLTTEKMKMKIILIFMHDK